jgi:hypothetical protein
MLPLILHVRLTVRSRRSSRAAVAVVNRAQRLASTRESTKNVAGTIATARGAIRSHALVAFWQSRWRVDAAVAKARYFVSTDGYRRGAVVLSGCVWRN